MSMNVSDLFDEAPFTPCEPVGPVVGCGVGVGEHSVLTPGTAELADSLGAMLPGLDLSHFDSFLMSGDGWLALDPSSACLSTSMPVGEAGASSSSSSSTATSKAVQAEAKAEAQGAIKEEPGVGVGIGLKQEPFDETSGSGSASGRECSSEESDCDASGSGSEFGTLMLGDSAFSSGSGSGIGSSMKRCNTYAYEVTVKHEPLEAVISASASSSPPAGSPGPLQAAAHSLSHSHSPNTRAKGVAGALSPVRALAASASNCSASCAPEVKAEAAGPRVMPPKPEGGAGKPSVPFALPTRGGARLPIIVPNTAGASLPLSVLNYSCIPIFFVY